MLNIIIWIATIILYSPILKQLYKSRWESIDYTHAYFILPVSLWLLWRMRRELHTKAMVHGPWSMPGLVVLVVGLLTYIFGYRQDYLMISSLSLIPFLFGMCLYLYGPAVTKLVRFPILYLLLMVPPPLGVLDSITLPMRHGVSIVTAKLLAIVGYPVTRAGLLISVGEHDIYMGAPCSGFRSLITMIALGLVYVYLIKNTRKNKIILFLSVIPLALVGNIIRVGATCLATYHWGASAGEKFHDYGGYGIFVLVVLGLVGLEMVLSRNRAKPMGRETDPDNTNQPKND